MSRHRLANSQALARTKLESSTASDHRRSVGPRGQISVTPEMREALRRYEAGETTRSIAASYGRSVGVVHQWLSRVREADLDARRVGP